MIFANFSTKADHHGQQAELLRRQAADQCREPVGGHLVGGGVEVRVALLVVEGHGLEQRPGLLSVGGHRGGHGDEVRRDVALAAEHVGVVVDGGIGVLAVLQHGFRGPHQPVGGGVVGGRLDPARDLDGVDAQLLALHVGRLGAVLQALQQLVRVPLLRFVVLDVAGVLVVQAHEVLVVIRQREDQADEAAIGLVAHDAHEGGGLLRRHVAEAIGHRQGRLVAERDRGRPPDHGGHGRIPGHLGSGLGLLLFGTRRCGSAGAADSGAAVSASAAHTGVKPNNASSSRLGRLRIIVLPPGSAVPAPSLTRRTAMRHRPSRCAGAGHSARRFVSRYQNSMDSLKAAMRIRSLGAWDVSSSGSSGTAPTP